MNLLPYLNVLLLFFSGIAVAVVFFVAIGLLLDLVPRETEKPREEKRRPWLWRFLHLRLSS